MLRTWAEKLSERRTVWDAELAEVRGVIKEQNDGFQAAIHAAKEQSEQLKEVLATNASKLRVAIDNLEMWKEFNKSELVDLQRHQADVQMRLDNLKRAA